MGACFSSPLTLIYCSVFHGNLMGLSGAPLCRRSWGSVLLLHRIRKTLAENGDIFRQDMHHAQLPNGTQFEYRQGVSPEKCSPTPIQTSFRKVQDPLAYDGSWRMFVMVSQGVPSPRLTTCSASSTLWLSLKWRFSPKWLMCQELCMSLTNNRHTPSGTL